MAEVNGLGAAAADPHLEKVAWWLGSLVEGSRERGGWWWLGSMSRRAAGMQPRGKQGRSAATPSRGEGLKQGGSLAGGGGARSTVAMGVVDARRR